MIFISSCSSNFEGDGDGKGEGEGEGDIYYKEDVIVCCMRTLRYEVVMFELKGVR